ncbi:hypothetical protein ACNOYE_24480 [Nannocystaceae bacterium ST9]
MPASLVLVAALQLGEPFAIRLHEPVDDDAPTRATQLGDAEAELELAPIGYEGDAVPPPDYAPAPVPPSERKLGSNTTLFVNFDGVHIGACNPSNSHRNCHWLKKNTSFDPWSGSLAERVAILDGIRSLTADYGIRVTGRRPDADEPYTMVVYGGDSVKEEALGRAPSGDCWDDLPNEIAYAFMDASRASWINGGASTALHEAAHTWGFDHLGLEGSLMAPSGGNTLSAPFAGCGRIVSDVEFDPEDEPSCPEINLELCGLSDYQNDTALLRMLFGDPYVDDHAPEPILIAPFDGIYYEAPATFDVDIDIDDDLDPQHYQIAVVVPGLADEPHYSTAFAADFTVESLPVGTWTFDVRVRDEAGNEGSVMFVVEVGEDPALLDDGCNCAAPAEQGGGLLGLLVIPLLLGRPRSQRKRRA